MAENPLQILSSAGFISPAHATYDEKLISIAIARYWRLNFIPTLLALGCFLAAQFRLDEDVDLAVHHFLDVARLRAGAVIFHHLIRLENVGPNFIAPRDLTFLTILPVHLGAFLFLFPLIKFRF